MQSGSRAARCSVQHALPAPRRRVRFGRTAGRRGADRILRIEVQIVQTRWNTEHRLAGVMLQPLESRPEQCQVAAEAIDHEAGDPCPLRFAEQRERADELREGATAIDVGDEGDRAAGHFCEPHVGHVTGTQVDLGRRACALDEDELIGASQPVSGSEHRLESPAFEIVIRRRIDVGDRPSVDDDLRAPVARRLEQHRIHVPRRIDAGGERLQRLSTADLAPVGGHCAVEGHVLRLERRDPYAAAVHHSAEPRDERALAGIGPGPLNHQRSRRHRVDSSSPAERQCIARRGRKAVVRVARDVREGAQEAVARRADGRDSRR